MKFLLNNKELISTSHELEKNSVMLDLSSIENFDKSVIQPHENGLIDSDTEGLDNVSYGRLISKILAEKLRAANIEVKNNKVKIILSIDRVGALLDFELAFNKKDPILEDSLKQVLSSVIYFPPDTNLKKSKANYLILLF